ncbi:uncharacterized protein SPPG_07174 [Spizellomyces punctatus DAOM BR117]|uniref:Uncharacterized protein n=1 Tax=Spizellomyces punctatus (strain DAOM BR117) TaxID=645134 RepID=A0A0L0H948_SPIPD|nr:uncharacterized protein SPPG_07174 [Spizellomyces punctatus DAOM BR117]KNC97712.1 hypothetical protein SPPG_07174 [Spizellomyces punctatus DAOM BR117]|eukprot:XP_016605752.1 hypothetical protein SPPG_07174 [Spizellomyces punctatus DAOM BR117]
MASQAPYESASSLYLPSTDLTPYHPLPEEILQMSEAETACQYCGISYLLLTKYERMQEHVKGLEKDLRSMQDYARERPELLARMDSLSDAQQKAARKNEALEEQLKKVQEDAQKSRMALEDAQAENQRVTNDLEVSRQKYSKAKEDQRRQIHELVQILTSIRAELLDQRKQVNIVKADVRQTYSRNLREILPTVQQGLTGQFNSYLRKQCEAVRKATQLKAQGDMGILQKELDNLRGELQDSQDRNDRLMHDINIQKLEASEHINTQKNYAQGLQATCLKLEDQLHAANTLVADLTHERDKLRTRMHELESRFSQEKDLHQKDICALENRIAVLDGKVALKERELKEALDRFKEERRSLEEGGTALANAHRAMAQKDEQVHVLERTVRDLHSTMQGLRAERQKTIEAHQSRIKQLQDKFLEDIKEAGRTEADKREAELRRTLTADKEEALRHLRETLNTEMNVARDRLQRQIDALRLAKDEADLRAARQVTHAEENWERKYAVLNEQLSKLQSSNAADFAHYQARIRALEEQLALTSARPSSQPCTDPKELADLKSTLAKREAEIKFLKETVRLECEERMELLAKLSIIQRGGSGEKGATTPQVNYRPSSATPQKLSQTQSMPHLPPAREMTSPSDPGEKTFQALMKAAAAKKGKVLAARSSADLRSSAVLARGAATRSSWSMGTGRRK